MSEKSHVSLEAAICPVCGAKHQTGTLLLDPHLRPTLERETATHFALCPEHKRLQEEGYIALVGVDSSKHRSAGTLKVSEARRTGRLVHIKGEVWGELFDVPAPDKGLAFVDDEVIDRLQLLMAEAKGGVQ